MTRANGARPCRVAITGYGSINALGTGADAFAAGLREGRCGIGPLTVFPGEGFRVRLAAEVAGLAPPPEAPRRLLRGASRTALLALHAAGEAWRMARLESGARVGLVLGTTTGGMADGERAYQREFIGRTGRARLRDFVETPISAAADVVAQVLGCGGPRLTISTACSSGANALAMAADWIRSGRARAVLCGGADSLSCMSYSGFHCLQALDREPCRPFDRRRAGITLGEGAALFVLERWDAAAARGAAIVGELVGYGTSADAHHLTQPQPDGAGAVLAMQRALEDAGLEAAAIDGINAHGTGTPQNDLVETRAIKQVFGARAYAIPVSSTKSQIGHCLGAAGAIEALAVLLAVRDGIAPATVTLGEPDPQCDLDYVPGRPRAACLTTVLSSSYGFGGNNTSLVLRGAA